MSSKMMSWMKRSSRTSTCRGSTPTVILIRGRSRRGLIKKLMATAGHGLISGQWGTGKTFVAFDLAAALMTGQPFVGHTVKRQCGVLFIAAEGADEVRLRLDAVVREKCGNAIRVPFCWYETAPILLHKDADSKVIAMAQQADASLQRGIRAAARSGRH